MSGLGPNTSCKEGRKQFKRAMKFQGECRRRGIDINDLYRQIEREREIYGCYGDEFL